MLRRLGAIATALALLSASPGIAQSPPRDLDPFAAMVKDGVDAWNRLTRDEGAAALPPLKPVEPAWFNQDAPLVEVASPDGTQVAGIRDGQLYVRARTSDDIRVLAGPNGNARWTIEDALWSPDGRFLAAKTIDDSAVPRITLTGAQFGPSRRQNAPYSRIDEPIPQVRVAVIEIETGRTVTMPQASDRPYINIVGWSEDSKVLRLLMADRYTRVLELFAADAASGTLSRLHSEANPASVTSLGLLHGFSQRLRNARYVTFLPDGSFTWLSDRSGYAHLYLYDPKGRRTKSLTKGRMEGFIDRVLDLDAANRRIFALATGFDARKPYAQRLVRIDLDRGVVTTLAQADSIPLVHLSPDFTRIRMINADFPDRVDIVEISDRGGPQIVLYRTDWSRLERAGYVRPQVAMVPAADGRTPIRAVIKFPIGFDPAKRYPIIHNIYGGQHTISTPLSPRNNQLNPFTQLSQAGFITVFVDGRGTPGRGRAFQTSGVGQFGEFQVADQIAGLKALAKTRPYMDLSRVGIVGGSWGGYFGLRTALTEPKLYKAAALYAGAFEMPRMRVSAEHLMGCSKTECPAAYRKASNFALLDRLETPLLLLHGTADNDVPIADTRALAAELTRRGKPHEVVEIDGWNHFVNRWPEFDRRTTAFFARHLGGPQPTLR